MSCSGTVMFISGREYESIILCALFFCFPNLRSVDRILLCIVFKSDG